MFKGLPFYLLDLKVLSPLTCVVSLDIHLTIYHLYTSEEVFPWPNDIFHQNFPWFAAS